jgi:ornithine carbamoyltransferase
VDLRQGTTFLGVSHYLAAEVQALIQEAIAMKANLAAYDPAPKGEGAGCIPTHRREAATVAATDSWRSVVSQLAENRRHAQKYFMLYLMK